jgi:hypothetical protein
MQEQFEVIQLSDLWRMMKEYNVHELISRDELGSLVKAIN